MEVAAVGPENCMYIVMHQCTFCIELKEEKAKKVENTNRKKEENTIEKRRNVHILLSSVKCSDRGCCAAAFLGYFGMTVLRHVKVILYH